MSKHSRVRAPEVMSAAAWLKKTVEELGAPLGCIRVFACLLLGNALAQWQVPGSRKK